MQSIQIVSAPVEPAGFCSPQPPVQPRRNLFNELPTPQQLHDQEQYKDCLKQQVWTFSQLWFLLSVLLACCLTSPSSLVWTDRGKEKKGGRRERAMQARGRERRESAGWTASSDPKGVRGRAGEEASERKRGSCFAVISRKSQKWPAERKMYSLWSTGLDPDWIYECVNFEIVYPLN